MQLFEQETIEISRIHSVLFISTEKMFTKTPVRHFAPTQFYELIFFLSGETVTHFDGKVVCDMPNTIRYLPRGNGQEYWVEEHAPTLCIDIFFETDAPMSQEMLSVGNLGHLKPLFRKIHQVWEAKKTGYYADSMSILYEIIGKIQRYNHRKYQGSLTEKIRPSLDYMTEHFSRPHFDFQKMGKTSGLSYDYFKELFVKEYGMPPVRYLTILRLNKAKELLLTGRYSVTEVAELCGFDNVYYFSNVFKKHIGVSPKQYRE